MGIGYDIKYFSCIESNDWNEIPDSMESYNCGNGNIDSNYIIQTILRSHNNNTKLFTEIIQEFVGITIGKSIVYIPDVHEKNFLRVEALKNDPVKFYKCYLSLLKIQEAKSSDGGEQNYTKILDQKISNDIKIKLLTKYSNSSVYCDSKKKFSWNFLKMIIETVDIHDLLNFLISIKLKPDGSFSIYYCESDDYPRMFLHLIQKCLTFFKGVTASCPPENIKIVFDCDLLH